jgi:uncharacterized protein YcaQ
VKLTNAQAVRAFLAAQGFRDVRPTGRVDARHFRRVVNRVSLLQIDSVNVVTRAHYVPVFARLGPYAPEALDAFIYDRREMVEYWCHEQSYVPVELYPTLAPRMEAFARRRWASLEAAIEHDADYIDRVLDEVRLNGPLPTRALTDPGERTGPWWGYGKGKRALEYLFATGQITVGRRINFERHYDLPERVVPPEILDREPMSRDDSLAEWTRRAIAALGVATAADLCDYFRTRQRDLGPIIDRLVAAGELVPVHVAGWDRDAYADPGLTVPRAVPGRALVAPFDSLVWDRRRTERMFDFRYRIEIYVPEPKRTYGYYVFPFRLDEAIVARVDLKADRVQRRLLIRGVFGEPGIDRPRVATELLAELESMAEWLGLNDLEIADNGDLAESLRAATA